MIEQGLSVRSIFEVWNNRSSCVMDLWGLD
jgi:hypothetical protein